VVQSCLAAIFDSLTDNLFRRLQMMGMGGGGSDIARIGGVREDILREFEALMGPR
jgi:hypothetical protein